MDTRILKPFINSAATLLILTAAAKLYSAAGSARILTVTDPLLHMRYRYVMGAVGLIEVAVAFYLLMGRHVLAKSWLVFWLSSNFILYRFGNAFLHVRLCPCLGTLSDTLPISRAQVDFFLLATVLYLFFGSSFLLLAEWNRRLVEADKVAGLRRETAAAVAQS
jgi:hypothetical protein